MTERAYCRVYYTIKDDPKFEGIREDDHHLATWLRLLMAADAIWPASPDLPASARRASVKALVAVGIVDLLPGGRYRIHGLDAERGARRDAARSSAAHRTYNERTAFASPFAERSVSSHSEPSQAEPSQAEPSQREDDLWALYGALTRTVARKPATLDWLERLETTYGLEASALVLREEHAKDGNPGTLLSRTNARLEAEARKAEKANGEAKASERRYSGMAERRIEAFRFTGKWDPTWGPQPVVQP